MLIFPLATLVCLAGCQLSGWGTQAWLPHGTGNLSPRNGDRTTWPALEGGFLTAGPPEKSARAYSSDTKNHSGPEQPEGLTSSRRRGGGEEADKQVNGNEQGAQK